MKFAINNMRARGYTVTERFWICVNCTK